MCILDIIMFNLYKRGYYITKDVVDETIIRKVKNELYVCPENDLSNNKYKVYRESSRFIIVPRFYGMNNISNTFEDNINDGISIKNVIFNGILRNETKQNEAAETTLNHLYKYKGGILSLPTGYGKTTVALNVLSRIKQRTIIFVHKEFLMNQWIDKIKQFLPNACIGKIQGKVIDVVGKDIVVACYNLYVVKIMIAIFLMDLGLV